MGSSYNEALDGTTIQDPVIIGGSIDDTPIGQTTPVAGDFKPLIAIASDAITSFTGTISAATRTATFSSTADYNLCEVGSTLIADGDTRIIVALLGSDQITVDINTTWAGATAITSLQDPISQHKNSAGNVDMYVNALGGVGLLGGTGNLQKGIAFGDGDSGIYENADNDLFIYINGTWKWRMSTNKMGSYNVGGGVLGLETSSNTIPSVFTEGDTDTGIGRAAADQLSLIAGGVEGIRIIENSGSICSTFMGGQSVHKTDAGAANYDPSILTSDYIITTDTTAAARAVTISTEDRDSGSTDNPRIFIIKDIAGNAGANNITISLETAGTIDGSATAVINTNYNSLTIAIDGTNGYII